RLASPRFARSLLTFRRLAAARLASPRFARSLLTFRRLAAARLASLAASVPEKLLSSIPLRH
ncbi:MAG TPA: hypothetical protein VGI12_22280, partial [Vicinamibacterales bacterium]